jgi:hypothetical protein
MSFFDHHDNGNGSSGTALDDRPDERPDERRARSEQQQPRPQQKGFPMQAESQALAVLGFIVGALLLSLLGNLILLLNNRALTQRGSVYVQQPDGFTEKAQEFDELHRQNETLKRTVATWIQLTFEWDNRIPNSNAVDEGMELAGVTVPTKAYLASIVMEDGFRREFLRTLGRDVVPVDVYTGSRRSLVRFYSISTPRQIADGRWEVDVVSTRIELLNGVEEREVDFNRTFTLQAIPPIEPALEDEPDAFRREAYALLNNGLLITEIRPLDINDR